MSEDKNPVRYRVRMHPSLAAFIRRNLQDSCDGFRIVGLASGERNAGSGMLWYQIEDEDAPEELRGRQVKIELGRKNVSIGNHAEIRIVITDRKATE